jgi:branched-chain amino acid transport system permease protein
MTATLRARLPHRLDLPTRSRGTLAVAGFAVVYLLALAVTGWNHGYVHDKAPLGVMILGIVYGSATALGAFGLILIYRANRFINFAISPLGAMVGILAIGLVKVHGLNYWIALPMTVAAGALVGGLFEKAMFHREASIGRIPLQTFRTAPRLIVTVYSIALAGFFSAVAFAGTQKEGFSTLVGGFNPPFNLSFTIDHVNFDSAAVLIIVVVPAVIASLSWFLLKTDAGIAVRAAAENEDRALLLGVPVRRLSTTVWVMAGGLAALAYMLQAPFNGVTPPNPIQPIDPTVLLPVLAAAVVARMESLPTAFVASVGLGMVYQIVTWNAQPSGWFAPSVVYPCYLIVILVALLAQSGNLSRAKESGTSSWASVAVVKQIPSELAGLPEVRAVRWALIAVLVALFVWIPHGWSPSSQLLAGFAVVWAMVGVSLVVLSGWSGQISLGQFGIAGVAALVAGNMVARLNSDFFLVILCCAVTGSLVALVMGFPALRIKGQFLAVTTLAVAVVLDQYFLNSNTFPGFIPAKGVPRPLLLQRFDLNNLYELYVVCLVFLALAVLAVRGIRKARAGRVLIGIQDNERAALAASVPATRVKLAGFVVAGAIAGVAGGLDALLLGFLNPGSFPGGDSITVFIYAVVGGLASVAGVLVGVFFFQWLSSVTALGQVHLIVSSVAALTVLNLLPGGLGQLVYGVRDRLLRVVADRRGIVVPSLVADKRQGGGPDLLSSIAAGDALPPGGADASAADAPTVATETVEMAIVGGGASKGGR